jgi:hypothetical protein
MILGKLLKSDLRLARRPLLPNSFLLHFRDRPVKEIAISTLRFSARIGYDQSGPFFCECVAMPLAG